MEFYRCSSARRSFVLGAGACLAASWLAGQAAASSAKLSIGIVPLGRALAEADIEMASRALSGFYGFTVNVHERVELPQAAFYAPRQRYRAERLLDFLEPLRKSDELKVLGLTAVDISTTKGKIPDWGILGLATIEGTACVLSSFRCGRQAKTPEVARHRLGKVTVHEIGHTLGLDHCPTRGCLMEDARGSVLTSDREYDLCARCRSLLESSGLRLPSDTQIPWTRP